MSILSAPYFHNEAAAIARLEAIVWPSGPNCPHCGGIDRITSVKGGRAGLRRCGPCKREFTVTVGTVFERSHVKLHKWFQAAHLLASSKKGISAHQLHRTLRVTYKTAWFMEHRLREAMRELHPMTLGGEGKTAEADETFIGNKRGARNNKRGPSHKHKVVSLVEREGHACSFNVADFGFANMRRLLITNIDRKSNLMTDDARHYRGVGKEFAKHEAVEHTADEYVRGEAHTNTVEGFYSIFKRGMKGVYQHCGEQHLHRYLTEFDFRFNTRASLGLDDEARAGRIIHGIVGKRLMYRDS